ncbi:MAG: thiamine pyrophosphate-dependent dehydrogenase E1 component subunit alpha [SAR202 cluster bacterium]|jgi:pyruvate dehydrogenase E1 component alpha subunit|nr:thiamine pyrophosphate-dependent dehydrogenase E1 component subunit alpha [SAR202 cluster bacterium]MDP6663019.1 thiamine pyrophosphate-dependent dehydrogenase E1 component subunit alpha [SAR202 cluster bacterium]MQG58420.1 thiamine pyrophosphate-dependent dehydrogenase E1 component subunit alpha [SAR202 cluster bacterium]MQG69208.1 thiamine pyrophosphate-dependent dehydrogenase E1 component subunit alpha [SAR202 cluster bacterium]HAL46193.1 acetoin:2,6-dichlorophenolindophenol oxidoreductas|tara:strand:+ start:10061 stop:11098 length:1038 start_codon:yes stop_codon:yes gene_type:complete
MDGTNIHYPYQGEGVRGFDRFTGTHPPADLVALYRSMLRIRRIEEEIERRYHEDQMKTPIHLVIGQEATAVGCAAALRPKDLVYSSHRTHGAYLAKGGDLKAMLSEMHCRANGCAGSRGGSMHLIDKRVGMAGTSAIVGGAVPIATGAALAAQMKGDDRVVVVFLGDATTEEGVTSESLNFAALKQVPVIFFCENNFYSVQSPLWSRQPNRDLHAWAAAHRVAATRVDGTNVLAVYDATRTAVARARSGGGPTFIEAPVYRFRAHGGAGDDSSTGYRSEAERQEWEAVCPIAVFGDYLERRGLLDGTAAKGMEDAIAAEIAEIFAVALESPDPTEEDLYRHVYAE